MSFTIGRSRRTKRVVTVAVAAVATGAVVLSWRPWADSSDWVAVQGGDAPTVLTMGPHRDDVMYMSMAYVPSELSYFAEEDCFVAGIDPKGVETGWSFIVWPYGTVGVRDGERVGVKVPGSRVIWVGDKFGGGGGPVPQPMISRFFPDVPSKCTKYGVDTLHSVFAADPGQ